ncbi:hypothetical protein JCM5353_004444 [Sporobolomyces roseus]
MDGPRWSLLDAAVDTSLSGYASTAAMSTREPLSSGPPHPLLDSFNSLLSSLLIPISLPSLALATPTLLLTVLESLLETRLIDVPEDYRGSWERNKRTRVAEVLIQAIGEVLDGLARSEGNDIDQLWRQESVQVRAVVRGAEGELAKLADGLLRIAEGLGIRIVAAEGDSEQHRTEESPQRTPKARPSTQMHRPLPIFPSKPSSNTAVPLPTSKPPILFATRTLHLSPTLPPLKPPAPSISSRSSSSSHSSHSTSLTVPSHRPSLAKELERSGTLSPPPRMPGSPRENGRFSIAAPASEERRARSTLQLMRERREEVGKAEEPREVEAGDVFLTPWNKPIEKAKEDQRETKNDTSRISRTPREAMKEHVCPETNAPGAGSSTGNQRGGQPRREKENGKGKGKERERTGGRARRRSKEALPSEGCCEGCGSTLLSEGFATSTSSSTSICKSEKPIVHPRRRNASSPSHRQRTTSSRREGGRKSKAREEDWCECHPGEGEEADASEEEKADSSSSSTLGKTTKAPSRHRHSTRPRDPGKTHPSHRSTPPSKPPLIPSPSVRRVRLERNAANELAEEAALLSIHGESEIERFENSHQNSHSVLVSDPPPPHATSHPTPRSQKIEAVSAAVPSPYTMLLWAQRAELAEKLRALERRERDRIAARAAQGVEVADRVDSNGTVLEV